MRTVRWSIVALLLIAPLVAMQFTDAVAWTAFDFAAAAVLLVGGMLAYEVIAARLPRARVFAGATIGAMVAVVWAEAAVGLLS